MNTELFILFVMAPLFTAVVLFALGKHRITQRCISLGVVIGLWIFSIAALIHVLQNGIVVLRMGNWQAPYGIILVADGACHCHQLWHDRLCRGARLPHQTSVRLK